MSNERKCFGGECLPALSMEEIYAIALELWPDPMLAAEMAATAKAESDGIPNALGRAGEYGLWQIHPMHFDSTHSGFVGNDKYNNSLKKLGIINDEGQSLSDPRINARAADAIARHLDRYTKHLPEGDLDMDNVFYGRRDNPDFPLFLEQARSIAENYDPFAEGPGIDGIPTEVSTTNPTVNRFSPGINPADRAMIQTATRTGVQAPDYTHTPEMTLGYNVLTDSQNLLGFSPQFNKQINAAMNDKYGPNFMPIKGRIGRTEMIKLKRELKGSDPRLAEALGNPKIADFASGNAAIIGYATDEDAAKASKFFRQHGLAVNPEMPFIVTPLGGQPIDSSRDVASQMWDVAIGSLWNTTDDDAGAF